MKAIVKLITQIKLWWKFNGKYYHRDLKNGIENLIRWFPTIWKDRDWDDYFIWEILKFKLKNQAKYIGNNDRHVSAKRDAEIMVLCVNLIEKIQNEYYSGEYMDYHNSDYNWIDSKDYPEMCELDIVQKSEHFDDYFKKYPRVYKQVMNMEKTLFSRKDKRGIATNMAYINEKRANKLLFKILEQNINKWWD